MMKNPKNTKLSETTSGEDSKFEVKIGIKTDGRPVITRDSKGLLLHNMLIGDEFHWRKVISVYLPGKVEIPEEINNQSVEGCRGVGADNVTLINTVDIDTYLECVVGSEMNPNAPVEFLKAQAIVARNWVLGKIMNLHHAGGEGGVNTPDILIGWDDTSSHRGFHVCSDDHCQRYQGTQNISPEAEMAINSTRNLVLVDKNEELIDTRFSKCCGGITEKFSTCWQPIDLLCLESITDPWCDLSNLNDEERTEVVEGVLKDYDLVTQNYGYSWETEITKSDIEKNLKNKFGRDVGAVKSIVACHRGPSGRIDLIKIKGEKGEMSLGKELWIRRLLSPNHLYSSRFDIEDRGDYIKLKGKGWGHGVGLCQIGAANMAAHSYDCKNILQFYFPGSSLVNINDLATLSSRF